MTLYVLVFFAMSSLMVYAEDQETVFYNCREYNGSTVVEHQEECKNYTLVQESSVNRTFTNGWYVFKGDVSYLGRINVKGDNVNFILTNDCTVNASSGINLRSDSNTRLTIWGQTGDKGVLNANTDKISLVERYSGIGGGRHWGNGGSVTVEGGQLIATSGTISVD